MAVQFSDDFEDGTLNAWTTKQSTWSCQNSILYEGTYSAKSVAGVANRNLSKTNNIGNCKISLYIYSTNLGTSGSWYPVYGVASTTGSVYPMLVSYTGHLMYWNGAAYANLPTDTVVVNSTWYHIEIYLDFTHAKVSWKVDGSYKGIATLKDTGNNVLTGATLTSYGSRNANATITGYIDNFSVEDWVPIMAAGESILMIE
jgi:hypothetical protein